MKQLLVLLMVLFLSFGSVSAEVRQEGTNFVQVDKKKSASDIKTPFTYEIKGVKYDIYLTQRGKCYIIRTSKTGNEYKQYLKGEVVDKINDWYKSKGNK